MDLIMKVLRPVNNLLTNGRWLVSRWAVGSVGITQDKRG